MTALLNADPSAVRRAAAALDMTADEASGLVRHLDRQQPPCWRSPAGRDYVGQLTRLGRDVKVVARSHEQAAEVLVAYAAALEEAQERARHAERLAAEGAVRSAAWAARRAVGPDPGWAVQEAARRTGREAEELERAAAQRAAAQLGELAGAAPTQGWTSRLLRPVEDAAVTAVDGWREAPAAVAELAGAAWAVMPWQDEQEQDDGRSTLLDAAQVWQAWLDAGRDAANGRPGLAAGVLLGPKLPRIKKGGDGGFLDGIHEGRVTVDDVSEAWDQAHAAKALQDRIVSLRQVPLPGIEALLRGEVDLAHHEARGGHTILRHVGKRLEVLQARLDLEAPGEMQAYRSTFSDLATSESLVRQALIEDPAKVRQALARPAGRRTTLTLPLARAIDDAVLRGDGSILPGRVVKVVLEKENGEVRLHTAYLNP